jgi:hypothetical protein
MEASTNQKILNSTRQNMLAAENKPRTKRVSEGSFFSFLYAILTNIIITTEHDMRSIAFIKRLKGVRKQNF